MGGVIGRHQPGGIDAGIDLRRRQRGVAEQFLNGAQIAAAPAAFRAAVTGLTDAQLDTPYRDGGWTVRQVVHHVPDSHINAYVRFKLALTEDAPRIKPYEESRWAELADARMGPEVSLALLEDLMATAAICGRV